MHNVLKYARVALLLAAFVLTALSFWPAEATASNCTHYGCFGGPKVCKIAPNPHNCFWNGPFP